MIFLTFFCGGQEWEEQPPVGSDKATEIFYVLPQ